ncbi:MAG: DUF3791 domain-containing protein [Candidatus Ancillula sp.]|nr:DUF3791 domain-containing protein [Candidatus Ancillula sp.]
MANKEKPRFYQSNNHELDNKTAWISFVINSYAKNKNISNPESFKYLYDNGAIDYLDDSFKTEHLESIDWTIDNIDEFIKNSNREEAL